MLFDEKGLFEKFEYKKLSVKPKFSSTEFTTDCSGLFDWYMTEKHRNY